MQWRSVLVVSHQRPDGDAIGSVLGVARYLSSRGIDVTAYVAKPVAGRYRPFCASLLTVGGTVDINRIDAVVCLDCATEDRLDLPESIDYSSMAVPICNIDHHVDNTRYGDVLHISAESAATAEIIACMLREASNTISDDCATALLLGIVTDTGGFRQSNTSAGTLATAAWLRECGADYDTVMKQIYYNESYAYLRLQARIVETMKFAGDRRIAYFCITRELLETYAVVSEETEDLIDCARMIRGVDIACRLQEVSDGVRFSFRSQNPDVAVNEIAHKLGGGGHRMAAGAYMRNIHLQDGEKLFLNYAEKALNEN